MCGQDGCNSPRVMLCQQGHICCFPFLKLGATFLSLYFLIGDMGPIAPTFQGYFEN